MAVVVFAVCHNFLFNLHGFIDHVKFITGPGNELFRAFPPTLTGRMALLSLTGHLIKVSWGWPMTIPTINGLAKGLLEQKGDMAPLGKNWYLSFLGRHPELKIRRSRAMDQARQDAMDKKTVQHWFDLFNTTRLIYNITDDDSYNMDEKGCMKGVGDNTNVIVPHEN